MSAADEKKLLLEGTTDRHTISQLVEAYGDWGNSPKDRLFDCPHSKSNTDLLDVQLPLQLKNGNVRILGVVLDADADRAARWQQFRSACLIHYSDFPALLPAEGLIYTSPNGRHRVGLWLMPDNQQSGMLETFLQHLVPQDVDSQLAWEFAKSSAQEAQASRKAPFREVHTDKAMIHTWLAWQDPPGQTFGDAISDRCLRPDVPLARQFIQWIWDLFELPEQPELKSAVGT